MSQSFAVGTPRMNEDELETLQELCGAHATALESLAGGATPDIAYDFLKSQSALADAARTAIPALIEDVRRLERQAKAAQEQINRLAASHASQIQAVRTERDEAVSMVALIEHERDEIFEKLLKARGEDGDQKRPSRLRRWRDRRVGRPVARFACVLFTLLIASPATAPLAKGVAQTDAGAAAKPSGVSASAPAP